MQQESIPISGLEGGIGGGKTGGRNVEVIKTTFFSKRKGRGDQFFFGFSSISAYSSPSLDAPINDGDCVTNLITCDWQRCFVAFIRVPLMG